jgi:hypothetical protein
MFRNLIFGSFLVPLGAALPLLVLFLGAGMLGSIFAASIMPLSMAFGQSFYILFGAYFFGWPAALLIGGGNGVLWLFVKHPYRRLLLALPVGFIGALAALSPMLFFSVRPLEAIWAWLGFGALGAIGSIFSALVIFSSSRELPAEGLPA